MAQLPRDLKRIRLNLAPSHEYPHGSWRHGYEFVAPLDQHGRIDAELWRQYRDHCGVKRFWGDETSHGRLVHKPGGSEHARWVFDYNSSTADDDEAGFRFGSHVFSPGEYVSISDDERKMLTFRVISVEAAA